MSFAFHEELFQRSEKGSGTLERKRALSLPLVSTRLMADGTQGCDAYEERMEKLESLSLSSSCGNSISPLHLLFAALPLHSLSTYCSLPASLPPSSFVCAHFSTQYCQPSHTCEAAAPGAREHQNGRTTFVALHCIVKAAQGMSVIPLIHESLLTV